ncbi:regulatory protein GntR, HTH:GntR, C-terminal [Rhodobacterales bacterium HTCC2255]|nr:regulatory protein GntR, HTH:GntR, C-terminal [Rhodobacterales bacterium HTCC2255]
MYINKNINMLFEKFMTKIINTVGSSTYEHIKKDIIYGNLAPGSKLKLDGLKKQYDASVSTLRETLNRLSSDGFVEAAEQRGFFVRSVSREDLAEIANLRILLECSALKTSIENGNADWEGNLVAAHHKLKLIEQKMLSGDYSQKETWKRYDWEFHKTSIEACNSQNLMSLHAIIFDKYLRYQMLVITDRGKDAALEHQQIFDAALSRNSSKAIEALEIHIRKGLEHTLANMKI